MCPHIGKYIWGSASRLIGAIPDVYADTKRRCEVVYLTVEKKYR